LRVPRPLLITNHFFIRRTSNRPNITYATRKIIGSLGDYRNLQFVLPPAESFESTSQIPSTIIFHDDTKECSDAAIYLDNLLPQEHCSTGIIRHYHSNMSRTYLDLTYKEFQAGTCRILHTCSGMESGIDFKRADVVIQYGTPADGTLTIQRGGRGGRDMKDRSLFLIMYEPWAVEVNLDGLPDDGDDPDRPFSSDNKKYGSKLARTGLFSLRLLQSRTCIRRHLLRYLRDESSGCTSLVLLIIRSSRTFQLVTTKLNSVAIATPTSSSWNRSFLANSSEKTNQKQKKIVRADRTGL
jgi:superfamily II DNA helicase RecQ